MCIIPKTKIPEPPPMPTPPNPRLAAVNAQADQIRRSKAALAPRSASVMTSPTGDPSYGSNAQATRLIA